MKIFSKYGEKIKNWIFTDEFDEIYTNATTKVLFVTYCCCGGFCFHNDVRPRFKKLWIVFNILNFLFVYSSCSFYFFNIPTKDYNAWLLPAPILSGVLCKIILYAWIFSGKDVFSKLIDFFNNTEEENHFASFCRIRLMKHKGKVIIGCCCVLFLGSTSNSFENFVSYENYFIQLYPTYFSYEKTITRSIVVRCIQSVTLLPELIAIVTLPTLIIMITINIYNRFEQLAVFLRKTTYSVSLQMEDALNFEMAMDERRVPRSLSKIHEMKIKKALALDELARKIIIVIERHQKLYRTATFWAKHMEYICTAIHMDTFVVSVTLAFFTFLITDTNLHHQLICVAFLCSVLLQWLVFCFTGEMFYEMNGIIAREIYDSPWYLLEPKDRRLVYIFLTIIRRPIFIATYRICPVNLLSFPDTLNTIYSQAKILRTLQLQKQKH